MDKSFFLHYNGSKFEEITSQDIPPIYHLWGLSQDNIYAVGRDSLIMHFDGQKWSEISSGVRTEYTLNDVWFNSSNNVYSVGDGGIMLHYDGNTWKEIDVDISNTLNAIWGYSSDNIFAVGAEGTIIHYDGNTWSNISSDATNSLNGIWGSSSDDVFAVGDSNTIMHYDGNTWEPFFSGFFSSFSDVWGTSPNDVFAVGGKEIYHYDGSTWTSMEINYEITTENINSVFGTSSNNVYAVGDSGLILHYDGSMWQSIETSLKYGVVFYDVWARDYNDIYIAGFHATDDGRNILFHYNGSSLVAIDDYNFYITHHQFMSAIYGDDKTIYAVGPEGSILYNEQMTSEGNDDDTDNGDNNNGNDNSCVATALFGPDSPEINTIRKFRDNVLMNSCTGKYIVSLYYNHNSYLKSIILENQLLKKTVKRFLLIMMPLLNSVI